MEAKTSSSDCFSVDIKMPSLPKVFTILDEAEAFRAPDDKIHSSGKIQHAFLPIKFNMLLL